MMEVFGPLLLSVQSTNGLETQKVKRNPVLNQLIALSETEKYSEAVVLTALKVSH